MGERWTSRHSHYYLHFCVLPGNAADNLFVLDMMLNLLDICQVKLQLIITPQMLHINQVFWSHVNSSQADLLFSCSPSSSLLPCFACFCRNYYSLVTEIKLSLQSLLIWSSPPLELPSFGTDCQILPESLCVASVPTAHKTQFCCWLALSAQIISHAVPTEWVCWRADCCLATNYNS
jgi:hypothetical protein